MNSKQYVQSIIKEHGVNYNYKKQFTLANGSRSHFFVDIKQAFANGDDLLLLGEVLHDLARDHGMDYNVIGGMELGAVPLAITMTLRDVAGRKWFILRKQPKRRGTHKLIEGYIPTMNDSVLIVEDVVSTGTTVMQTYTKLRNLTHVVGIVGVVDRSHGIMHQAALAHRLPYAALFTDKELL